MLSSTALLILFRFDSRSHFLLYMYITLKSSHKHYKIYSGNLKLDPQCIPMHILSWTDCGRPSSDKILYRHIFLLKSEKNNDIFLQFQEVKDAF
jgi:hypothetical protein